MQDLKSLDWIEILNRLSDFATAESTRTRLQNLKPLEHPDEAVKSFSIIEELRKVLAMGERPYMESVDLFSTWSQRLKKQAVLTTLQLKDVRHFCLEALALKEVLQPFHTPYVEWLVSGLIDAQYPLSAIDQLMTPAGEIRTDASERLHSLYNEKNSQSKSIQNVLDKIIKQHDLEPVLQDRYVTNREGRLVLPVKSGMRHHFSGLIHAQSTTKQTVYMEPEEIIPLNNRLKQVEADIDEEIEHLLRQCSEYLSGLIDAFVLTHERLIEADFRFAMARMAQFLSAVPVHFSKDKIELHQVRHPLMALRGEEVIPNSVKLEDTENILLLSGPNAGGKTVLLKGIGLAAHMARCGLPICAAEDSTLPFFKSIHVAVGDSQSVEAQLSTFAAHLKVLNEAAKVRGKDHLLLIDEICGSTDPEEGSALARAFIETYSNHKIFGVITSHLGPLKLGWSKESGVTNGSMEYSKTTGKATYQFVMGVPGQSFAIRTAERVGVDPTILNKAMEYLSPQTKAHQSALKEVESLQDQLKEARDKLHIELKETREAKQKYQLQLDQFQKEKQDRLERAVKKAEQKIDDIIGKAKVEEVFKKHERMAQIKMEIPEIVKASTTMGTPSIETVEQFEKAYPSGTKVFVPHLNQDGVIQGQANSKGEVPVLVSSMRLFVNWKQLKPANKSSNPTGQILRRSNSVQVSLHESQRVIDLRGQNVEDALGTLEIQLDQAALSKEDRVKIVHGVGTETLKKAVRNYLSRSVYIRKWTAGNADTGGDGSTWAELGD